MNLAQQIAARMLGAKKSVMGSVKSGAAGAPAAETGSKSEKASGTQPRHLPTRALELVPPGFIRERNAEKRADPIQPTPVPMAERRQRIAEGHARRSAPEPVRAVSTRLTSAPPAAPGPRTITERPPPLPPRPPRAELEFDLVQGLQAVPLPAAPLASSAPTPAARRGRGSCFALDAETGRQCRLPAHPEDPDRHRNERGPFFRVLERGQVPRLHDRLDSAAMASTEAREVFAGHGHASPGERKTRKDAGERKSAHAGDSTSTGIKSIDTTTPEASP